ncbi:MAG: hypothetical protein AAF993_12385 [Pseudomonadota bacterium]
MAQKKANEPSADLRRQTLAADVEAYLAAGNTIEKVPSGTSSQNPQGSSKPLRPGPPNTGDAVSEDKTGASEDKGEPDQESDSTGASARTDAG